MIYVETESDLAICLTEMSRALLSGYQVQDADNNKHIIFNHVRHTEEEMKRKRMGRPWRRPLSSNFNLKLLTIE